MGNGACCAGIPAGTALSSAEVRALLGDRFHQSRFDELAAAEGGDTVTVEQLQHEIAGSIRSHHYPPDFRPSRAPTKGISLGRFANWAHVPNSELVPLYT